MMKKQLLLSLLMVLMTLSVHASSGIFLRGSVNNWDASTDWEFVDEGNGIYTLTNKVLSGDFKIASEDWNTVDYGCSDSSILLGVGTPMTLVPGTTTNIFCAGTLNCTKIILTIPTEGDATLLIEGTISAPKSGFYLRGDVNGWGVSPEWEFTEESSGIYTLSNVEISDRFKIADSSWNTEFGSVDINDAVMLNTPFTLILKGADISCGGKYKCSKITVNATDIDNITLLLEGEVAGSGIFLRGGFTNWNPLPDWEFMDEGNGVYTLKDKEIFGKFKIGGSDWITINYGVSGGILQLGSLITLEHNGNDISCGDDTFICTKITLTVGSDGITTLLVEGSIKEATALTEVYIIGDNNGWNFNDDSAKLSATGTEGEFKGTVVINNASDQEVGFWRLYEGLGQVGSWGNPGGVNTSSHTISGTLERGSDGCITTSAGTYNVTFNIKTGAFSMVLDEGTGVSTLLLKKPSIFVDNGIIKINGSASENIRIFSIDGAAILTEKQTNEINATGLNKGIYIIEVMTEGKTYRYKIAL